MIEDSKTANRHKIEAIQKILFPDSPDEWDGIWGPVSQAALDAVIQGSKQEIKHQTYASSFADPADVQAFKKCKAQGKSDDECFKVGDNGVGCWGDSTVEGTGPSCALPPEYMEARWGSTEAAKNKKVAVNRDATNDNVICVLKDRMPHLENLANEARIDLNPDACAKLNLEPPVMEKATWWWIA